MPIALKAITINYKKGMHMIKKLYTPPSCRVKNIVPVNLMLVSLTVPFSSTDGEDHFDGSLEENEDAWINHWGEQW